MTASGTRHSGKMRRASIGSWRRLVRDHAPVQPVRQHPRRSGTDRLYDQLLQLLHHHLQHPDRAGDDTALACAKIAPGRLVHAAVDPHRACGLYHRGRAGVPLYAAWAVSPAGLAVGLPDHFALRDADLVRARLAAVRAEARAAMACRVRRSRAAGSLYRVDAAARRARGVLPLSVRERAPARIRASALEHYRPAAGVRLLAACAGRPRPIAERSVDA